MKFGGLVDKVRKGAAIAVAGAGLLGILGTMPNKAHAQTPPANAFTLNIYVTDSNGNPLSNGSTLPQYSDVNFYAAITNNDLLNPYNIDHLIGQLTLNFSGSSSDLSISSWGRPSSNDLFPSDSTDSFSTTSSNPLTANRTAGLTPATLNAAAENYFAEAHATVNASSGTLTVSSGPSSATHIWIGGSDYGGSTWTSFDSQTFHFGSPVPEPRDYGEVFIGLCLVGGVGVKLLRDRSQRKADARKANAVDGTYSPFIPRSRGFIEKIKDFALEMRDGYREGSGAYERMPADKFYKPCVNGARESYGTLTDGRMVRDRASLPTLNQFLDAERKDDSRAPFASVDCSGVKI